MALSDDALALKLTILTVSSTVYDFSGRPALDDAFLACSNKHLPVSLGAKDQSKCMNTSIIDGICSLPTTL